MTQTPIRILLVDDRPPARAGMRALLQSLTQQAPANAANVSIEILGEAGNGKEALKMVENLKPDVVVMDVCMPDMDGLEATRVLKARWPQLRIVVLSMYAASRGEAITAGADAYLVKGCSAEDLFAAILGQERKPTTVKRVPSRSSR